MKNISLLLLVALFLSFDIANAQETTRTIRWKSYINIYQYLEPFCESDTIYDETIQPIKEDNDLAEAKLFFKAKKIIEVRNAYLKNEFRKLIEVYTKSIEL